MIAGQNGDRNGAARPLWVTGLSSPDSWRSLRQPGYPQLHRARHSQHRVWGYDRKSGVSDLRLSKVCSFRLTLTTSDEVAFIVDRLAAVREGVDCADVEQGFRGLGRRAGRRGHGGGSHRPPCAPLPYRQHPRQQLPDEGSSEPAAVRLGSTQEKSRRVIADSNGGRSGDTRPLWITGLSSPDSWRSLCQPGYLQLDQVRTPKHCVWGYDRTLKVRNFQATKVGNFQSQLTMFPVSQDSRDAHSDESGH